MPWHVALDQAPRAAARQAPDRHDAARDRPGVRRQGRPRIGIRVQDLLDPKILRQKIEVALAEKNVWLERVYGVEPLELEELADTLRGLRAAAAPVHRRHVAARRPRAARRQAACCSRARRGRCSTSTTARIRSSPRRTRSPASAATGIGIGPTRIDAVVGVAKAYVTRVGEGPFPTEIEGPDQERVRELGARVRHGDRARAALRLARPRRAPLRGAAERDHVARADEARRALGLRRDPGLRALPAPRRHRRRDDFPAHQSDFHHARAGLRGAARLGGAARRRGGARRPAGRGPALRRVRRARARGRRSRSSAPAPTASSVLAGAAASASRASSC